MQQSKKLEQQLRAVRGFQSAFEDLARAQDLVGDDMGDVYVVPAEGREEADLRALRERVALTAGPAAVVVESLGRSMIYHSPPVTGRGPISFNPIRSWNHALHPSLLTIGLPVDDLRNFVSELIGELEAQLHDMRGRERSLPGLIARVLTFPDRVREAAGWPKKSAAGRFATGFGWFVVTIFAGTIATAIGGLLVLFVQKLLKL